MIIEVRVEEPTFSSSDVRRYLYGPLPLRPKGSRWTWPEVALLLWQHGRKGVREDPTYLLGLLSPDFFFCPWGLYLHGIPPHGVMLPEEVLQDGRFRSEGVNNHVHLGYSTRSNVQKFDVGVRVIRSWIYALRSLPRRPRRVTLFLTKLDGWQVCAYSDAHAPDLLTIETGSRGPILRFRADDFLLWAFPPDPELQQQYIRMPTQQEERKITAAAKADPNAQPLLPAQLQAMVPLRQRNQREKRQRRGA